MRLWTLGWMIATSVALSCTAFGLAQASEPYVLTYEGAPGCPNGDALRSDVRAHVHDTSRAQGTRVDLRIVPSDGGFAGHLVAWDEMKHPRHRSVGGADCTEVAHALAFLAALAIELGGHIEPDVSGTSREPTPAELQPPLAPPPAAQEQVLPRPFQSTPAAVPPAQGLAATRGSSESRNEEGPLIAQSPAVSTGVVVMAEVRGALVDSTRPALVAAFDVGDARDRFFSPGARIALFGSEGQLENARGSAELWLLGARLEACPVRFGYGPITVRPCIGAELGSIDAHSHIAKNPRSATELWASLDLSLRLRWAMTDRVFVEVSFGPTVLVNRPRYFFERTTLTEQDTTLFAVPPVSYRVAIGPGFSFE